MAGSHSKRAYHLTVLLTAEEVARLRTESELHGRALSDQLRTVYFARTEHGVETRLEALVRRLEHEVVFARRSVLGAAQVVLEGDHRLATPELVDFMLESLTSLGCYVESIWTTVVAPARQLIDEQRKQLKGGRDVN